VTRSTQERQSIGETMTSKEWLAGRNIIPQI
jgi:hypothetical protein